MRCLRAASVFLFAWPATLEFFPHGCDLSEIFSAALGGFSSTDLPRTLYNKTIWHRPAAMRAFEHVRSLRKGLLSCQQRFLKPCDQLSSYYIDLFDECSSDLSYGGNGNGELSKPNSS
jgi:hypothetical protein